MNDAALTFEPESSQALGFGFRCGFLGLLHMDVVQERLEREFNLDLITTAPSVTYHVDLADGSTVEVENPAEMPDASSIKDIKEPFVKASIMVPNDYVGPVMELCQRKRGIFETMEYLSDTRVNVIYHIPLSEIIFDFFDKLKSSTRGYASLDYEIDDYRPSSLVKIDILLNGDKVDGAQNKESKQRIILYGSIGGAIALIIIIAIVIACFVHKKKEEEEESEASSVEISDENITFENECTADTINNPLWTTSVFEGDTDVFRDDFEETS